jgi:hypothetical protein
MVDEEQILRLNITRFITRYEALFAMSMVPSDQNTLERSPSDHSVVTLTTSDVLPTLCVR